LKIRVSHIWQIYAKKLRRIEIPDKYYTKSIIYFLVLF